MGNVVHRSSFLREPLGSDIQKGKKRQGGGDLVDLLWDPGQVSFSLWFPVFMLLCSCLFLKGSSVLHRGYRALLPHSP